MGEADWSFLSGGLDAATVRRGVTAGFTPPNGGGSFTFGFNSLATTPGAVGLYVAAANNPNFDPLVDDGANPTGGSIRAAIKRSVSGGPTGFAPFLFMCLQGSPASVNDLGYLLGLSDNDPHEVVLRKGAPAGGLDPTSADVLAVGTATYPPDTWVHLRLDVIVNPNDDVVLKAFQNDLGSNPVTAPVWAAIPGINDVYDDALGVTTTSLPFKGGRVGYGFETSDLQRRGLIDHVEVLRQR
jgi:hypothetical protein